MRTYTEALAYAKGQVGSPTESWYNLCQKFSRLTFGAAAWAPSAREAFNATPAAHRHTSWPPRPGSIAYWGNAHTGAGHATPILDTCYSNDIYRRGQIDPVRLTASASSMPFVTKWGLPYRGWIDTTPSGPIPVPTPPPAKWGGRNIGWGSDQRRQIETAQRALGVPVTGTYVKGVDDQFRAYIELYQGSHLKAAVADRTATPDGTITKPGVIGPRLYASLLVHYPTG